MLIPSGSVQKPDQFPVYAGLNIKSLINYFRCIIEYKILQGKLNELSINLEGPGEVLDVDARGRGGEVGC